MVNGITNNSKTHGFFLLWLIACFFLINTSVAGSLSINVYLKLKPQNSIKTLIEEFNQFLEQHQVLSTYHIKPYLEHHPLHLTLYLADYSPAQLPIIINKIDNFAQKNQPLILLTNRFVENENGYVMLAIKNEQSLQRLSNKVVHSLMNLRDKNAVIPAWAAQNKERQAIFAQYGSPNVLHYFNPHFSVLMAMGLNAQAIRHLYAQLQSLTAEFNKKQAKSAQAIVDAIGIGIADEQGQIIQELKSISLNS